jgi:hypothetical protein
MGELAGFLLSAWGLSVTVRKPRVELKGGRDNWRTSPFSLNLQLLISPRSRIDDRPVLYSNCYREFNGIAAGELYFSCVRWRDGIVNKAKPNRGWPTGLTLAFSQVANLAAWRDDT